MLQESIVASVWSSLPPESTRVAMLSEEQYIEVAHIEYMRAETIV